MPTYRITGPDGRTLTVTGPTPPSEAEIDEIFARMSSAQKPTPQPATPSISAAPSGPSGLDALPEHHTALETAFGVINTVPRMIQQGVTSGLQVVKGKEGLGQAALDVAKELNPYSKTTGETPLEELGMEPGMLRAGLGLGLDLVSPIGPVGGLIKGGVKLAGQGIGKGVAKASALHPKIAEGIDTAKGAVQEAFVQYPGMSALKARTKDMTAEDMLRLQDAKIHGVVSENTTKIGQMFAKIPLADRQKISYALNPVAQGGTGMASLANRPDLQPAAQLLRNMMDQQYGEEVVKGVSDPNKMIQEYFPWIIKHDLNPRVLDIANFKGTSQFSKSRTMKDWTTAAAHGAETDAAKAVAKRLEVGQRAVANVDFFEEMAKEFGTTLNTHVKNPVTGLTTTTKAPIPAGHRLLNVHRIQLPETSKVFLADVAFPAKLADQLEKGHVMLADPSGLAKLVRGVNKIFKTTVTTFNPAHHANNLQGNLNLMRIAGMSPSDIVKGYKDMGELHMLQGAATPKKGQTPQQFAAALQAAKQKQLRPGITLDETFKEAMKYNLFGSTEGMIEMSRLGQRNPLKKSADEIRLTTSRWIEDPARWALFKDYVLKAKAPTTAAAKNEIFQKAAIHVKNHLFDANELTDLEKGIREFGFVPFYSWLRKNTALQVKTLASGDPKKWRELQVLYEAPERLTGGKDTLIPDYAQEEGYVPIGDINEQGQQPTVRLANPALDLNKLTNPIGAGLGGGLGPLYRAGVEYLSKHNLRTGQKILNTETGYAPASPIGTAMETLATKTGLPFDKLVGTQPTLPDGKIVQPEMVAFAFNQIPLPLMPYAQQLLGTPGENLGTQLATSKGRRIMNTVLRFVGLTPKNIPFEQQVQIMNQLIDQLNRTKETDTQVMKATGAALRQGSGK